MTEGEARGIGNFLKKGSGLYFRGLAGVRSSFHDWPWKESPNEKNSAPDQSDDPDYPVRVRGKSHEI
jgi:hypothetical protein